MKLSVFRFQKLLRYRQYQEDIAKDQLRRSYAEYKNIEQTLDSIREQKTKAIHNSKHWIKQQNWNHLWMNERVNLALKSKMKHYNQLSQQAERVLNEQRQVLDAKRKKVRMLENLKQRHHQAQLKEYQINEQVELDELTQFKFYRQHKNEAN